MSIDNKRGRGGSDESEQADQFRTAKRRRDIEHSPRYMKRHVEKGHDMLPPWFDVSSADLDGWLLLTERCPKIIVRLWTGDATDAYYFSYSGGSEKRSLYRSSRDCSVTTHHVEDERVYLESLFDEYDPQPYPRSKSDIVPNTWSGP